jgi:hypothetical protein
MISIFEKLLAVALVCFFFICDLYYEVASEWFPIIFCLVYLLFRKTPSKAIADIVKVLLSSSRSKKTKDGNVP